MHAENMFQIEYRSVKGKNGIKRVTPLTGGPAPPVPQLENTDTDVYDACAVVKLNTPFGPWYVDLARFTGEDFTDKYMDMTQNTIRLSVTPGRYAIAWADIKGVPVPYPTVPLPVLPVVKQGLPRQYWLPRKLLRELDIPKLTSRQADHAVFLQRLDQASRAVKHEYKLLDQMCTMQGIPHPNFSTPQIFGLGMKLQNQRSQLIEDFLRSH
jgi:hypothetical protein